jgi:hypothetical protein
MEFVVHINREGITNKEIIKVREWLSEVTSREFKSLCDGNTFSVAQGCSEDALKCSFRIQRDTKEDK